MSFLELFDETLDINSTENYVLSLQAGTDGLSFCLLDTVRNKFVLFRSFGADENKYINADKLGEFIRNDDFLSRKYKRVNFVIPSAKFTLVPSPLYDPAKKTEYFAFNHVLNEEIIVLSDKTNNPDAFVVFSIPKSINAVIDSAFPGANKHHHLKLLLENVSSGRKNSTENYIQIHIERDFFNIVVYTSGILKLCNSFSYRNISDVLYYVLGTFRNLDIRQEETVYFSGLTEKYDDLSSGFSLYIRNIKFARPSGNFTFSYVFNDMELHRYINLFNLVNCES